VQHWRQLGSSAAAVAHSATVAARWLRRWRQRDIVTSATAWRRRATGDDNEDDGWQRASQHATVDLKLLIVSVIPINFLDTINLFCFLFFILIYKLIAFSAS
jgi:hypothetical protein